MPDRRQAAPQGPAQDTPIPQPDRPYARGKPQVLRQDHSQRRNGASLEVQYRPHQHTGPPRPAGGGVLIEMGGKDITMSLQMPGLADNPFGSSKQPHRGDPPAIRFLRGGRIGDPKQADW